MTWDALLAQLRQWLDAHDLAAPHATWVVGVSGGADSSLLLHALVDLNERADLGLALNVAHLHHGIRGADADEDERFVQRLAAQLSLPFHRERADIPSIARESGGSTEEVARQRRYDFLERVALRCGSDCVAVAHHADDNAETVVHRIARGTGLRGLGGMRPIRPVQPGSRVRLVRPLLSLRRAAIEALCAARGIASRTDASNLTSDYTRGRVRNTVLPLLREQLNPNVTEAILRLSEQARWLGDYLEDAGHRAFDSMIISADRRGVSVNIRALLTKQRIIQAEIVRRAVALVIGGEQDVSFGHVDAILRLAVERSSGKELHLPGAARVQKFYDRLEFRPLSETNALPEFVPVFVACPGATDLPVMRARLESEVCPVAASKIDEVRARRNPFEEWLDFDRVRLPLLVRGRREGDRFWPLGAPGTKSLGDFFSDEKLDPVQRARTGVLCDQAGPIWIMPLRIDERVKLRETSERALHLRLSSHTPRGLRE